MPNNRAEKGMSSALIHALDHDPPSDSLGPFADRTCDCREGVNHTGTIQVGPEILYEYLEAAREKPQTFWNLKNALQVRLPNRRARGWVKNIFDAIALEKTLASGVTADTAVTTQEAELGALADAAQYYGRQAFVAPPAVVGVSWNSTASPIFAFSTAGSTEEKQRYARTRKEDFHGAGWFRSLQLHCVGNCAEWGSWVDLDPGVYKTLAIDVKPRKEKKRPPKPACNNCTQLAGNLNTFANIWLEDTARPASNFGNFSDGSFALPTEGNIIGEGVVQDASRYGQGREVHLPGTGLVGATEWSRYQSTMNYRDLTNGFAQDDWVLDERPVVEDDEYNRINRGGMGYPNEGERSDVGQSGPADNRWYSNVLSSEEHHFGFGQDCPGGVDDSFEPDPA
ncbi:hypothetical protein BDZ45DRAFT_668979 [Acephala macrosclerotiorum]|nr:hypothetical protein BDZ45DRAFT_668979 [Acephala macrosclerotiorum]